MKKAAMAHRSMALAGDATDRPPDVAKARAPLGVACEEAVTAGRVREQIDGRVQELEADVSARDTLVLAAAREVLWNEALPASQAMATEIRQLQERLADVLR